MAASVRIDRDMSYEPPVKLRRDFERAFNSGDLDAAVALFEADATLVTQAEGPVSGLQALHGRQQATGF
ncbi:MAG TPA: hypothetical protein VGH38_25230 [Bryobacteraceae bacterium]|jgi:ketosteroid isomerase-like protein